MDSRMLKRMLFNPECIFIHLYFILEMYKIFIFKIAMQNLEKINRKITTHYFFRYCNMLFFEKKKRLL